MLTTASQSKGCDRLRSCWEAGCGPSATQVPMSMASPTVRLSSPGSVAWVLDAAGPLDRCHHSREMHGPPGLVLRSVRVVNPGTLVRVAPLGAGMAFEPGTLLALLTYCYASGVYGSQDIESLLVGDTEFRWRCGNEFPQCRNLRRFRRYNAPRIEQCLAEVLSGLALGAFAGDLGAAPRARGPQLFRNEAARRIDIAKVMDLVADET